MRECFLNRGAALLTVIPCLVAMAGCSVDGEDPAMGVWVRDSAGIELIVVPEQAVARGSVIGLAPTPVFSVGDRHDTEDYLHQVRGGYLAGDSAAVIADGGSRQIRIYRFGHASGSPSRQVGGRGGGPGEFNTLSWIGPSGAGFAAWDTWGYRMTWYDADLRPSTYSISAEPGKYPSAVAANENGAVLLTSRRLQGMGVAYQGPGVHRDTVYLLRASVNSPATDTLVALGGQRMMAFAVGDARTHLPLLISGPTVVRGSDTTVAWLDGQNGRVTWIDFSGRPYRVVRLDFAPRPITAEEAEAAREALIATYPKWPNDPLYDSARRLTDHALREVVSEEFSPPASDLLVASDGTVWLELGSHFRDAQGQWVRIDSPVREVRRLRLPENHKLLDIREGRALVHAKDSLGVESVRIYPIGAIDRPAIPLTGSTRPQPPGVDH